MSQRVWVRGSSRKRGPTEDIARVLGVRAPGAREQHGAQATLARQQTILPRSVLGVLCVCMERGLSVATVSSLYALTIAVFLQTELPLQFFNGPLCLILCLPIKFAVVHVTGSEQSLQLVVVLPLSAREKLVVYSHRLGLPGPLRRGIAAAAAHWTAQRAVAQQRSKGDDISPQTG